MEMGFFQLLLLSRVKSFFLSLMILKELRMLLSPHVLIIVMNFTLVLAEPLCLACSLFRSRQLIF